MTVYAAATRAVGVAARELSPGSMSHEAFQEALAASEAAHVECDNARRALLEHKKQHGC
jgi:hypothetical protein